MQNTKRKRYQKDSTHTDDILTLIHLVRQNPALYNYKLQPNQRRRIDVLNGWAHIAAEIGNKYTVEECRRKWKNLRDTYHQYRLRKPRFSDGLSKWRYAKDLEFLSTVYQPKLKTNRQPNPYDIKQICLPDVHESVVDHVDDDHDDNNLVHSSIALVNDDAETFILTSYEEGVPDDVTGHTHIVDHSVHMELTNNGDTVDIVKNEHVGSMDDDVATGAEVDYEEVCLYEEAGNVTETIISGNVVTDRRIVPTSSDSKAFQYIGNDFCIESINTGSHLSGGPGDPRNNSHILASMKLKDAHESNCTTVSPNSLEMEIENNVVAAAAAAADNGGGGIVIGKKPDEWDLFFEFLKKKFENFTDLEVNAMQMQFLGCVQKFLDQKQQQQTSASSMSAT